MEDKVLSLLEKMYADLNAKIENINSELKEVKSNIITKDDLVQMKNDINSHTKILLDKYKQNPEVLHRIELKVDDL